MVTTEIVSELRELRRGRGVGADDLHQRIGPHLRAACSIADTDIPALARRKLILHLVELGERLPHDLKVAALTALAVPGYAGEQFLDQRIARLATIFGRDPRTARRRVDQALELLAEQAEGSAEDDNTFAPDGWYTQSLRSVLRMDLAVPQLTEERTIITTNDELDELLVSLSAPKDATVDESDQIQARMVYGGEIVGREQVGRGHVQFTIRLPAPLSLGHRHDYSIEFTAYPRSMLRPYYVLHPLRRCDHFRLHVRFDLANPPERVWRLDGVPTRVVDDFADNGDAVTIDRVGDVMLEFESLRQGLSYGLQWTSPSA